MSNKYLEKAAGIMGKVKAFGEVLKGTAAKETKEALKKIPANKRTMSRRAALSGMHKEEQAATNRARMKVGVGAAGVVGTAGAGVAVAKKKD